MDERNLLEIKILFLLQQSERLGLQAGELQQSVHMLATFGVLSSST